jgi:hypothetical protein
VHNVKEKETLNRNNAESTQSMKSTDAGMNQMKRREAMDSKCLQIIITMNSFYILPVKQCYKEQCLLLSFQTNEKFSSKLDTIETKFYVEMINQLGRSVPTINMLLALQIKTAGN